MDKMPLRNGTRRLRLSRPPNCSAFLPASDAVGELPIFASVFVRLPAFADFARAMALDMALDVELTKEDLPEILAESP